jgi:hypothetical protein
MHRRGFAAAKQEACRWKANEQISAPPKRSRADTGINKTKRNGPQEIKPEEEFGDLFE